MKTQLLQWLGIRIWNTCEFLHISLGKLSPTIFGWALGVGERLEDEPEDGDNQ